MDTSRVQPIKLARVSIGDWAGPCRATSGYGIVLTLHSVPAGHQGARTDRLSGAVHSGERAGPGGRDTAGWARAG